MTTEGDDKKDEKSWLLTTVEKRSTEILLEPTPEDIAFQHSIFCQTALPYRNPGDDVREWERRQGGAILLIEAGKVLQGDGEFHAIGLPFGPKARLILAHLNTEALRQDSPNVEVEGTLTAFVKRLYDPLRDGRTPNGRQVREFKNQLLRLSGSTIRLGLANHERITQVNSSIIKSFDLWPDKDDKQRVLWPSSIHLGDEYFNDLRKHAVPLDERALAGFAHSAMGIDIYCWLAQRLHRIPENRPQLVPWVSLYAQFGQGFERIRDFRKHFIESLRLVHAYYSTARIDVNGKGLLLHRSVPPVPPRFFAVRSR